MKNDTSQGWPKVIVEIVKKLPFHKLTGSQVFNLTADILGLIMYVVFMSKCSMDNLSIICFMVWFCFVVWCIRRAPIKKI